MTEKSVGRRVLRSLTLWRSRGGEMRPIPSGGLSVSSCSKPGRSYRVSLAGEGRCGCADGPRRQEPRKHIFAALIWAGEAAPGARCGGAEDGLMAATLSS